MPIQERVKTLRDDSVAAVYEIAIRAHVPDVERALRGYAHAERMRDPGALVLRAVASMTDGDVPTAIGLLRRAHDVAASHDRLYVADILQPLLFNVGSTDEAQALIDAAKDVDDPALAAAFDSAGAILAATAGRDAESRRLATRALRLVRSIDSPVIVARVLQRLALAAFHRDDFIAAEDHALEAARRYERLGVHRYASLAYQVLYAIAADWRGDADLAWFYAAKMTTEARKAGDLSNEYYGIASQFWCAAEGGDERRVGALRSRLIASRLPQQYRELFGFVISETLVLGWRGNFEGARANLIALRKDPRRSDGERAVCDGLLALCATARWNLDDARPLARSAVSLSAIHLGREPLWEVQRRRVARVLAAGTCLIVGDPSRGRKALSRSFDPDGHLTRLLTAAGMNEQQAPPFLRGYARFVNAAAAAAATARPRHDLTQTELEILRVLPDGETVAAIASMFGKSAHTVERQITSIYHKLDVSNRAQAIRRARELGIS